MSIRYYSLVPIPRHLAEAQREAVWESVAPIVTDAATPVQRVDLEGYPPDQLVAYASAQAALSRWGLVVMVSSPH